MTAPALAPHTHTVVDVTADRVFILAGPRGDRLIVSEKGRW